MMALKPLKVLYTGVWASGYMKRAKDFLCVSIKNINLTVFVDDTFSLQVNNVIADDTILDPFNISGKAQVLYKSNGEISEILLSELYCKKELLDDSTIFSISKERCTRLPIPCGEAFFCFSSRLPELQCRRYEEELKSNEILFEELSPNPLDDFDFDEIFEDCLPPQHHRNL